MIKNIIEAVMEFFKALVCDGEVSGANLRTGKKFLVSKLSPPFSQ